MTIAQPESFVGRHGVNDAVFKLTIAVHAIHQFSKIRQFPVGHQLSQAADDQVFFSISQQNAGKPFKVIAELVVLRTSHHDVLLVMRHSLSTVVNSAHDVIGQHIRIELRNEVIRSYFLNHCLIEYATQ